MPKESKPELNPIADYTEGAGVRLDRTVVAALILLIVVGLGFRVSHLDAIGFAEDEVNKVEAFEAYSRGDITANGEHPMMMKALMFVSVKIGRSVGGGRISDETLFRFPNAIVGALTVVPLFLLTAAFFDRWIGVLAAGFWSVGLNAIAINRVGKEDTLLVFFMLFAFYFYLRAKQTSTLRPELRRRYYIGSGISFGLMLASKYFPHYFGLNALYHHYFRVRKKRPDEPSGRTPRAFYLALLIAFLLANPAVLLPPVWEYLNAYMGERLLLHSGYLFGDHLYKNNMSVTPFWGTPWYFYALFMAIKIPLLVLGSFIIGFIVALKHRRHPGHAFALFMFLFWIVPYSFVGAKWLRYTLSLMPFVYIPAAIGLMWLILFVNQRLKTSGHSKLMVTAALVVIVLGLPAWSAYQVAPHYALYTNALAADKAGYYFPHDEFYDDGLREAIKYVCDTAPQGAVIAHETPAVVRYYLSKFGRTDLVTRTMTAPDFDPEKNLGPAYFIIQRGRIYFENREKIEKIRATFRKMHEVRVSGTTAAEVFAK